VLVLPLLVQGIAMGLFFVAMLTIILDRLPPERIPAASGLTNFIRITGGSFATSITTTMWDRREALHQSRLVETLTPDHPAYAQTLDLLAQRGAEAAAAPGVVLHEVVAQSYLLASADIFRTSGWIVLALIPLLWLVRRPRAAEAGAAAAD
jgi:DHA2 family multidrug resistance protein